ncbi:16S rRNA (uracil1498-N3)-methyltransferase [bacterium A37T11]|nr:16S rRNA (uracil1498-N3)-methyltransferase [bacterium A37T11]
MQLFYTPNIEPGQITYQLNEEESAHCIRVLRLEVGSEIHLTDGRGGLFTAIIRLAHPKKTQIQIIQYIPGYGQRNHYLHIAVAPTKNADRFEWFLEKATEIGIDEISPILCERSERKELKIERFNKVVIAAMKQSLKAYAPQLNPLIKMSDFLKLNHLGGKYIAHCMDGEKSYLSKLVIPGQPTIILIGPEGDFSPSEVNIAIHEGFQPISLGTSRLRTETAALASCLEVNIYNRY